MMSISDIPPALSPISSTTSIQGLQSSMNNSNSSNHINNSGTNSVSTSPHAYSLDRYHEPSTNEKFKRNGNSMSNTNGNGLGTSSKNMSLPPISSFDNLIRAAEKQYASTSNNTMDQSQVSISATTSMTSLPLNNSNNTVLPHPLQQGVMTPVGSRTNMLSYQLSTEQRHRAPITRSILQHPPNSTNMDVRSESSRSLLASPTDSVSRTSISSSSSSGSSTTTSTASKSTVAEYKLGGTQQPEPIISRTTNAATTKITKPRKKKQCPICLNYYANLSTHKSTHLTPEDRPHRCPVCERGFARTNDLIRHRKRHWKDELMSPATSTSATTTNSTENKSTTNSQTLSKQSQLRSLHQIKGTFKCPFNSNLIKLDMEVYPHKNKILPFETSNCHQTGVFSRCDTYKNHLKALHFEYPPGTKKKDRSIVPGKCKHCGAKFENVDTWLNNHVGKNCGYIYH